MELGSHRRDEEEGGGAGLSHLDRLSRCPLAPQQPILWTLSLTLCPKSELLATQVASHWLGLRLLNIVVPVLTDCLFGLYGWKCRDELLIGT